MTAQVMANRVCMLMVFLGLSACSLLRHEKAPVLALAPEVEFASGLAFGPALGDCDWAAAMLGAIQKFAKGAAVITTSPATDERHEVLLEVRRFDVSDEDGERQFYITVRANVRHRGKVVSSLDYSRAPSVDLKKPTCPVLRKEASRIAEEFEDWL